jgi:pre-mRNA-splicing factor SYF2
MGLAPGTLSRNGSPSTFSVTTFDPTEASSSSSQVTHLAFPVPLTNSESAICQFQMIPTSHQQQVAAESLYRDANSLLYADNKPSDEAIDRVIGKINQEYVAGLYAFPAFH